MKNPDWLTKKVYRDVRKETNRQLRNNYGIDPKQQILVIRVRMVDGSYEWRAFGNTYQNRNSLRDAGFKWDAKRGFWYTWSSPRMNVLRKMGNVKEVL